LDLHHGAPAGLVGQGAILGNDAVDPLPLEAPQPLSSDLDVARDRRRYDARLPGTEQLLEHRAPDLERTVACVVFADRERVEGYERCGSFAREPLDARRRGMEPPEQGREVEPGAPGDHQLTVEHEVPAPDLAKRLRDFREVSSQRPLMTAAQIDFLVGDEREAAEPVPLWLVEVA